MKTTIVTKLMVPAMLAGSLFFLGNTDTVRPEKKEKKSSAKPAAAATTVSSGRNTTTVEYLKYIMPKAVQEAVKETATYRKDANGIYRLVANEGC